MNEETVAELLEGRIDAGRMTRVEQHLARCHECLRLVTDATRALATEEPTAIDLPAAADEPLPRGALVGRYEIVELVGAGATGRVYSARDRTLDRNVALKLLRPGATSVDLETRLLREAKAMAKLSHASVITVFDAGKHGDQLFIAMELVLGGTLRDWMTATERTWREVLDVFLRAGRGLADAHAGGIVHRDFKPDNVLVGGDGRVRVTDFGLARSAAEGALALEGDGVEAAPGPDANLTRTGALVGTPAYMAPEQLRGAPADVRCDIYAFCVSLYEALYGERPFATRTMRDLVRAKEAGEVRAPSSRRVPSRLRRAILAGLRPSPDERYTSMNALIATLERARRRPAWQLAAMVAGASATAALAVAASGSSSKILAPLPPTASIVSTGSAMAAGCPSNRSCTEANGGEPWSCRASDRVCVPIASADCVAMYEPQDLASDDTVWLGAMFPTDGPQTGVMGNMSVQGVELARREIALATRSLDGSSAALHVRRVALVACNDAEDPMRAARHLVDDVGVPAIVGFSSGQEVVDVAGSLLIHRRVLTFATLTSSPLITRLPQPPELPRLVWRTTYSFDAVADAAAHFVHDRLEPRLSNGAGATHVALARVDAAGGAAFAEALYRRLRFNGKSAVENGAAYQEIKFSAKSPTPDDLAQAAKRAIEARPTILVVQGPTASTVAIVEAVERGVAASHRPKPTYVVILDSTEGLGPFMAASEDRRHRVFSVVPVSSQIENARFVMRMNEVRAGSVTRGYNPGTSYDAFYVLAYAAFALGDGPVDGSALGGAIARLVPPGRPIENGPTDVLAAVTALSRGERIDLVGASGALDFDLTTGETSSDFALGCAKVGADGRRAGDVESGVVFRTAARAVEGSLHCP